MSYPNVIYGDYGDEKVAQATAIGGLPLGQLMVLPDGRQYRHGQAMSAGSIVAGQIVCSLAGSAGHGNVSGSGLIASTTAFGSVAVTAQNKAGDHKVYVAASLAAFTKDQFAGGFMNVLGPAASTYIGHVYKVKGNNSAASVGAASSLEIVLEQGDPLKADLASGSTRISLRKNPYKDLQANIGSAMIAPPMGVAPVAVSASFYCWVQRRGEASVLQAATVLIDGEPITIQPTEAGSAAPAVSGAASTAIWPSVHLGYALEGAAASQAVLCYLTLE